jgi:hypothetical protein
LKNNKQNSLHLPFTPSIKQAHTTKLLKEITCNRQHKHYISTKIETIISTNP